MTIRRFMDILREAEGNVSPIYTIGDPEIYDPLVADSKPHYKQGRHRLEDGKFYSGGAAFKSIVAARKFLQKTPKYESYHVYTLDGSWDHDVYWSQWDNMFTIKHDLRLVAKAWPFEG